MSDTNIASRDPMSRAATRQLLWIAGAAIVGLALAAVLAPVARDLSATITVSWDVVVSGMLLAGVLALASVALPSWRLYRLSVVAALGRR